MILPLVLLTIATLSAAIAVYGTLPQWSLVSHGLEIIEMTRWLQWPLVTLCVLLCLTLVVLVIAGKRRVWWLIGFAPIFALLAQLFVTGTFRNLQVVDRPAMVAAGDARFMKDDEFVVGMIVDDQAYTFPYRQLFDHPVILQPIREKRVALFWSAFANRATAVHVSRQIFARELEVISMPSNALLVYNARVGQFINGLTGLSPDGTVPSGFHSRVPTTKATWAQWRGIHPQTLVMALPAQASAPTGPIRPQYPMLVQKAANLPMPIETPIVVFATTRPVAIAEKAISEQPINISVGEVPAVLFRDSASGQVKAFERKYDERSSRFLANPSTRRASKGVFMLDVATNSGWNTSGVAVDGEADIISTRLPPITNLEEGLYYGVMREWYPEMELVQP